MPLRIVDRYPSEGSLRRLVRRVVSFSGGLLLLSGVAAVSLPVLFLFLFVISFLSGSAGAKDTDQEFAQQLMFLAAYAVFALILGRRLTRGRRGLVLFLRRFGFEDASRTLTFAVGTAVGRRWRIVTLDDTELSPVGVRRGVRWTFGLGKWIGILSVVAAIVCGYLWFHGGNPGEIFKDTFDQIFESGNGNAIERFFGALFGAFFFGLVIFSIIAGLFIIGLALISGITLFNWISHRSIMKAERFKASQITEQSHVQLVVRQVDRFYRRLFAPRLMVVRTSSSVWTKAVLALADISYVILIDVSEPTASLLWEVEALQDAGTPLIFVGRRDRLESLLRGGNNELESRLASELDGEEVLAYDIENNNDMRRFARSLGGRLNSLH